MSSAGRWMQLEIIVVRAIGHRQTHFQQFVYSGF